MLVEALLVLTAAVLFFLWYSGLFSRIEVSVGPGPIEHDGPLTIAYKYHTGSYWQVGGAFHALLLLVDDQCPTLGIYYDDPKVLMTSS